MKKIQLFAWMMLATMCLSFNACVSDDDDDDDTFITQLMLARIDDTSVSNQCFYDVNGTKLVPDDPSVIYTLTNGIYQFTISYNPNTISDGKVSVSLNSNPVSVMNPYGLWPSTEVTDYNLPLYAVNYTAQQLAPFMFDKTYLVIPVVFRSPSVVDDSEYQTELAKHRFVLTYDAAAAGDDTLVLHLTDKVSDPELPRNYPMYTHQAFDLSSLIANFKALGNNLKTITIKSKVNSGSSDMNMAIEETYTIEYKY